MMTLDKTNNSIELNPLARILGWIMASILTASLGFGIMWAKDMRIQMQITNDNVIKLQTTMDFYISKEIDTMKRDIRDITREVNLLQRSDRQPQEYRSPDQ